MTRGLEPGGRILVVKLSSLGDIFHALPAVEQIHRASGVTVDWVVQPEYAELVRGFRCVNRVIEFPRHGLWRGHRAFRKALRRDAYDAVLDLQGLLKSAWVARMAWARRRIGPSLNREGSRFLYSECATGTGADRHAVERAMDTVRWLGIDPAVEPCQIEFPRVELDGDGPRIALVPCSRWPTKNWPPQRFIEVARQLEGTCYLLGGPAEREQCTYIADRAPGVWNLCGVYSLPETGSILSQMDLAITVDTGPMHMAAALGIPVVAIFGPTDPHRTGPYGDRHRVIRTTDLACQPCFSRTCSRGDLACLERISADPVLEAVRSIRPDLSAPRSDRSPET